MLAVSFIFLLTTMIYCGPRCKLSKGDNEISYASSLFNSDTLIRDIDGDNIVDTLIMKQYFNDEYHTADSIICNLSKCGVNIIAFSLSDAPCINETYTSGRMYFVLNKDWLEDRRKEKIEFDFATYIYAGTGIGHDFFFKINNQKLVLVHYIYTNCEVNFYEKIDEVKNVAYRGNSYKGVKKSTPLYVVFDSIVNFEFVCRIINDDKDYLPEIIENIEVIDTVKLHN